MRSKKNFSFILLVVLIFLAGKYFYSLSTLDDVLFLVKPTTILVEGLLGVPSTFMANEGFYFSQYQIIINRSCSGFNLALIIFLMFTVIIYRRGYPLGLKMALLPMALLSGFASTVLINGFRIFSLTVLKKWEYTYPILQTHIFHEGMSILINLCYLITLYILVDKTTKSLPHAKVV